MINQKMKGMFSFIMSFSLMACSIEQAMNDPIAHFSRVQTISIPVFNKIELENYEIYRPWECVKVGHKYYLFDLKNSDVFASIDDETGCCMRGVNIGDGPDEVLLPERFVIEGNDVTFYDGASLKRYVLVETKDSVLKIELYQDIGIEAISYPTFHGDKMLTKGWTGNTWLRYYKGEDIIGTSDFPYFPETDVLSDLEKISVFRSGQQKFCPDGTRVVATIDDGCALAIFSCSDEGMEEIAMLKYYPPKFKPINNPYQPMTTSKDSKMGFVDVCCSEDYIFALYSGKIFGEDIFSSHYGGHVFVYDWEGNPIKHYKLEKDLFTIEIDESNGILYGIGNDSEGCILEYKF